MSNVISLTDIWKTYRTGEVEFTALKGINLQIEKGSFSSIMGPSGSGKSTLMNIVGLLDSKDKGTYELNGIDIDTLNDEAMAILRNQEIGFIFQSFNLLPKLNIVENVELPLIYGKVPFRKRRKMAVEALEKVGLQKWIKHKPTEISGGQKQRVAIARAIVTEPAILIADEPTGNLDSKSSNEIMSIIKTLNEAGTTILLITHEPEIAEMTKKIITIRDGKLYI
ncbi:MAG: macrolide ABC transporter ATP-binding protein [Clostridiales bacterium]|nr:MAG: macrolide ABC transporter ATP-binding protein [Clostridiales bacterium]